MMNRAFLKDLYAHMEWADCEVWRAVLASRQEKEDANLHNLLYHLHLTQRVFLDLWTGKRVTRPDPDQFSGLRDILECAKGYYPAIFAFLDEVPEERFAAPLQVPWSKFFVKQIEKTAGVTLLGETVLQVAMHSTYHRGQANRRIKELGMEPPLVDYIAWLWRSRPKADWPA